MAIEERLKELIVLKSGSVRSFAIESDIKYSTLRSILERGVMNANVENIFKIAEHLDMKPEDIAQLGDSDFYISKIVELVTPLNTQSKERALEFVKQLKLEQTPIDTIRKLLSGGDQYVDDYHQMIGVNEKTIYTIPREVDQAIILNDETMAPLIKKGEPAFYSTHIKPSNDDIVVVKIKNAGITCKLIKFDDENNEKVTLYCANEKYAKAKYPTNMTDIEILGKVIL